MAVIIEDFRWSLTGHGEPPGHMVFVSTAAVIVVLLSGAAYFQRMETTMADVV
jgi:lipopolysaccharide transport system permease protein